MENLSQRQEKLELMDSFFQTCQLRNQKNISKLLKSNADTIFLVSPNTSKTRIQKIAKVSTGFLYLVAVYGTTGVKTGIKSYTIKAIKDIKKQTKGKNSCRCRVWNFNSKRCKKIHESRSRRSNCWVVHF